MGLACTLLAGSSHEVAAAVTAVDGDATKQLTLLPLPHAGYAGRLSLALRNEGSTRVTLGVRYLRDNGRRPVVLGRSGSSAPDVMRLVHPRQSLVVPPQAVAQLALRFHLTPGVDASELDGLLVVRAEPVARPRSRSPPNPTPRPDPIPADPPPAQTDPPSDPRSGETDAPGRRTVVRLASRFGTPPGIAVEPARVTLRLNERLPFGLWVTGRDAEVALTGAEAQRLLAGGKRLTGTATLANDHGDRVAVRWRVEDGTTSVSVDGDPAPGSYSGTLPVLANTAAPAVSLTVKDRHAWFWAFLVVLAGVYLGHFLPVLGGLQRRKALIAATIRQTILDYREARSGSGIPSGDSTWVDRRIGADSEPWRSRRWFADPQLHGAAGFFSQLYQARDESDLDETEQLAVEIQASVRYWIKLAPEVRALAQLADDDALPTIDGRRWQDTGVYGDTLRLLAEASDEPESDAAMEARRRHIDRQRRRHDMIAVAWSTIASARDLGGERRRLVDDLFALATPTPDQVPRDDETWNACLADCERLRRALPAVPRVAIGAFGAAFCVARRHAALGAGIAMRSRVALFNLPAELLDRTGAVLASGARAVGVGVSRLLHKIGRALRRLVPGFGSTPTEIVNNLWWSDLAYTLVATIVAVIGYTVGVYGDTFGSPADYAKAFGIGLGTQAVGRWVAMPVFDSIRLRRGRSSGDAAPAGQAQAGAATAR